MRNSPQYIRGLKSNEIFVFGSNTDGRHGKGAAKVAMGWGAVYGKGVGPAGRTYAIPTKRSHPDKRLTVLPLTEIFLYVTSFIKYCSVHKELDFLVTSIGCGLAGYTPQQIAPLFREALQFENILLPIEFTEVLSQII